MTQEKMVLKSDLNVLRGILEASDGLLQTVSNLLEELETAGEIGFHLPCLKNRLGEAKYEILKEELACLGVII